MREGWRIRCVVDEGGVACTVDDEVVDAYPKTLIE